MQHMKLDKGADGIAVLTLDSVGQSMNVMTEDWTTELEAVIADVKADDAVTGLVITSGKKAFMAGADLKSFATALGTPATQDQVFAALHDNPLLFHYAALKWKRLQIELAPADLSRYGFDVVFRIREKTTQREVARGKVGVVLVDKQARKAAPMPDAVREKLLSV